MGQVGLRELRQQASELIRRVEAGEVITVTVSGRAVAELRPRGPDRRWRRPSDIEDLFAGPSDPTWVDDRDELGDSVVDPFDRVTG